uniref:Uncharacterized protein n=1 Tax=Leersia perrieri TaxID=77586 RepID=A0A0D9XZK7_9ORYZ
MALPTKSEQRTFSPLRSSERAARSIDRSPAHTPISSRIPIRSCQLLMGRGVSYGGGQSSLGYLFGGDEAPKSADKPAPVQKPAPSSSAEKLKEIPAGIQSSKANNYMRAEGQNCGNFLTDRPSTKVQAAPGGGSSLDYLFSGSKDGK